MVEEAQLEGKLSIPTGFYRPWTIQRRHLWHTVTAYVKPVDPYHQTRSNSLEYELLINLVPVMIFSLLVLSICVVLCTILSKSVQNDDTTGFSYDYPQLPLISGDDRPIYSCRVAIAVSLSICRVPKLNKSAP